MSLTALADGHATRMYFMARMAGWRPAQSIAGFVSFYDMPVVDGERVYPGMSRDVYRNPQKYWPYSLRRDARS